MSIFKRLFSHSIKVNERRSSGELASNSGHIYNLTIAWLIFLTLFVIVLLLIFLQYNPINILLTFLLVAGASFAGGAALGFLFGLPRAEKYRFIKKEDNVHNSKEYEYSDNTNLEEVSDWLTKIIVGLALIKLNTIINWIDKASHSIQNVFISNISNCDKCLVINGYVFGYCTIILYFLAGAGLCYLWARTNLSLIFTKSKKDQMEIEKQQRYPISLSYPHYLEEINNTIDNLPISYRILICKIWISDSL